MTTDPYYEAWVDALIEHREAEFAAEMAQLPPLDDLPPAASPN